HHGHHHSKNCAADQAADYSVFDSLGKHWESPLDYVEVPCGRDGSLAVAILRHGSECARAQSCYRYSGDFLYDALRY
ncbi:MAG: hypothetical protein QNL91_17770, partial [Candidatus Krumholzibacteria bacterium]|nr:hypothetical protein [Candidatus Krumholzibacteria bacterium]